MGKEDEKKMERPQEEDNEENVWGQMCIPYYIIGDHGLIRMGNRNSYTEDLSEFKLV